MWHTSAVRLHIDLILSKIAGRVIVQPPDCSTSLPRMDMDKNHDGLNQFKNFDKGTVSIRKLDEGKKLRLG